MKVASHQLRCTECAAGIAPDAAPADFRCPVCGGLYEVIYPWSPSANQTSTRTPGTVMPDSRMPNASALRWLWQERRTSTMAVDQSGVWRFRDLLPILQNPENPVTLREGNTPLYDLPRSAKALGLDFLMAKHQGISNPTGSFKDTGMTAALSVAAERGFEWVACASTGNTSAAMAAYAAAPVSAPSSSSPRARSPGASSRNPWTTAPSPSSSAPTLTAASVSSRELIRRLPIYLLNSVNPYRAGGPEDPRLRTRRAARMADPRAHHRPRRKPRERRCPRQRLPRDARARPHRSPIPKISVMQAEGANPLVPQHGSRTAAKPWCPLRLTPALAPSGSADPASFHKAVDTIRV